jgi:glycosyltransferase involved in cell wall biosynthesis
MQAAFDGSVVRPPYAGVQLSVLAEMQALAAALGDLSGCRFFGADEVLAGAVRARGGRADALPTALQRTVCRVLWQQMVLPRILRREGFGVLHALAYTAPLRCPVPYVLNVHDVIALEHPELCAAGNRWHMRCLLPGSARKAAACIVSTQHVAGRLQACLGIPAERIHVLPLGVDAGRFATPAPRPALAGMEAGRPYLLFVGNLEPKKDVGTLLDAYAACAAAAQVDLVLAGRAAWKCARLVARLRSWQGPGRVCWLGRVPAEALPGLLQHALALVMPSREEGFGMPVLEAMAAGTPVIHSDHPALVEAAGGAGVSFETGSPAALAATLDALYHGPDQRQKLAAAGRARAASLPWQRWGEGAVAVLRQAEGKG